MFIVWTDFGKIKFISFDSTNESLNENRVRKTRDYFHLIGTLTWRGKIELTSFNGQFFSFIFTEIKFLLIFLMNLLLRNCSSKNVHCTELFLKPFQYNRLTVLYFLITLSMFSVSKKKKKKIRVVILILSTEFHLKFYQHPA